MSRLWSGIKLVWLNAGFYGGLIFITAVSVFFVSAPLYCWFRCVRKFPRARAVRMLIWLYGKAWAKLLASFVPLRIEKCDAPLPKPCLIVPTHQAFLDTYF
ncbi:MAG: hypothetical protein LIP28_09755, partial [Deltaproteobacteria bacterium]|nr:hypothetical protein [Deltaproteobacteria bacterium]